MSTAKQDQEIHDCRRPLRMISELHVRGYQRLRVVPHLYELGTWRCGVTDIGNVRSDNGALPCAWSFDRVPQHSSAAGRSCFGWDDAKHATPSRLADLFLKRFPEVSARGRGPDWVYAGWLSWMLHETYPDCLLMTVGGRQIRLTPPLPVRAERQIYSGCALAREGERTPSYRSIREPEPA